MKQDKSINFRPEDDSRLDANFSYSISGKVITITNVKLGKGSLSKRSDEPTSDKDRLLLNDLNVRHLPTVVEERL